MHSHNSVERVEYESFENGAPVAEEVFLLEVWVVQADVVEQGTDHSGKSKAKRRLVEVVLTMAIIIVKIRKSPETYYWSCPQRFKIQILEFEENRSYYVTGLFV